jgi:transcriptional regulator with XRE-family HTH domain
VKRKQTAEIAVPSFAECLYAARQEAGLTGSGIKSRTGIGRQAVSKFENNVHTPSWGSLYRMLIGCNLGLEHFFPADAITAAADRIRARGREPAADKVDVSVN